MIDLLRTYTVSHSSPGPEVFQTVMNTFELEPKYYIIYNQPYDFIMTGMQVCWLFLECLIIYELIEQKYILLWFEKVFLLWNLLGGGGKGLPPIILFKLPILSLIEKSFLGRVGPYFKQDNTSLYILVHTETVNLILSVSFPGCLLSSVKLCDLFVLFWYQNLPS